MLAFVGQTRSPAVIRRLEREGIAEMFTAGQDYWPPRRSRFAVDCGTYSPWRHGRPWNAAPFLEALAACRRNRLRPEFVVCPDVIAQGRKSLAFSLRWAARLRRWPLMLAVQDGMTERDVVRVLHRFVGLFVGGTLEWKLATAHRWVALAHAHGKRCHVGRVGNATRVRWAVRIGADSIDSCQPLWCAAHLDRWLGALGEDPQLPLGLEVD